MAKSNRYDSSRQWYAIHTYSGYEEKVAESIRQRAQTIDMADKIFDAIVPKEKQVQSKNHKTASLALLPAIKLQSQRSRASWRPPKN